VIASRRASNPGARTRAAARESERRVTMGNPFCHIELHSDDLAKSKKFYKTMFDWKLEDMKTPDGVYTMIGVGKGVGGGMMPKMSPQAPPFWLSYVEVVDVKKATAKAKKLGAQVMVEYMPIGDHGAIGMFMDPSGAALGVWEPPKKVAKKAAGKKGGGAKKKK
jgi:predicted enzyme related to lactoylglutathione lyase